MALKAEDFDRARRLLSTAMGQQDDEGFTALMYALRAHAPELAEQLVEAEKGRLRDGVSQH